MPDNSASDKEKDLNQVINFIAITLQTCEYIYTAVHDVQ